MKNRTLLILLVFMILVSCNVRNVKDAKFESTDFILQHEVILDGVYQELSNLVINDRLVSFTTKPGSHILRSSCDICISEITKEVSKNIADNMDLMEVSYINYQRDVYIEYGLPIRNSFLRDYSIRYYVNISDSLIYKNPDEENYYLMENWILCSDVSESDTERLDTLKPM